MYIKIEVITDAKDEWLKEIKPDSLLCSIKEKAERNLANNKIIDLIRKKYGGSGVQIKIVSGHHSPHKIVSVEKFDNGKKTRN